MAGNRAGLSHFQNKLAGNLAIIFFLPQIRIHREFIAYFVFILLLLIYQIAF